MPLTQHADTVFDKDARLFTLKHIVREAMGTVPPLTKTLQGMAYTTCSRVFIEPEANLKGPHPVPAEYGALVFHKQMKDAFAGKEPMWSLSYVSMDAHVRDFGRHLAMGEPSKDMARVFLTQNLSAEQVDRIDSQWHGVDVRSGKPSTINDILPHLTRMGHPNTGNIERLTAYLDQLEEKTGFFNVTADQLANFSINLGARPS